MREQSILVSLLHWSVNYKLALHIWQTWQWHPLTLQPPHTKAWSCHKRSCWANPYIHPNCTISCSSHSEFRFNCIYSISNLQDLNFAYSITSNNNFTISLLTITGHLFKVISLEARIPLINNLSSGICWLDHYQKRHQITTTFQLLKSTFHLRINTFTTKRGIATTDFLTNFWSIRLGNTHNS